MLKYEGHMLKHKHSYLTSHLNEKASAIYVIVLAYIEDKLCVSSKLRVWCWFDKEAQTHLPKSICFHQWFPFRNSIVVHDKGHGTMYLWVLIACQWLFVSTIGHGKLYSWILITHQWLHTSTTCCALFLCSKETMNFIWGTQESIRKIVNLALSCTIHTNTHIHAYDV